MMKSLPPFYRHFLTVAFIFLAQAGLCAGLRAADLGPLPADLAGWTEETKAAQRIAGREMIARIEKAAAAGEKEIRIPAGQYRFAENSGGRYPAHIVLPKNLNGATIDFQGSTLWFETEASGLVLSGTKNTTLRNVFLDWDPLPFIQGTITAIDPAAGTLDLKIDAGYERVVPALREESWRGRGIGFDRKTRELKAGQHGCEVGFSWKKRQPDGSYRLAFFGFHNVSLKAAGLEVGDPFVVLKRMQRAVRLSGTVNCVLEDVTLYASPFIAFVHSGGGGATFRRCNILRRPGTSRLLAGNADGINCDNMATGPLIEDCRIETIGDDFVNVHGHLGRVIWQESETELITSQLNRRGAITEPVTVEFLERATMKPLGKRQATAEVISWKIERERCLADLKHKWHSGAAAGLDYDKTVPAHRLRLDRPFKVTGDVIVVCEAFSSTGAIIRNNHFTGSLARGLRLQSPHVVAENNVIALTRGPGLTLFGHAAYWGEGPYVYDATVRGNTFVDTGIGESLGGQRATLVVEEGDYLEHRVARDIRIENNTFIRSGGPAIVARGVDGLSITGNRIEGYGERPAFPARKGEPAAKGLGAAIVVEASSAVTLTKNAISKAGKYASGPAEVLIAVEAAPAATVQAKHP